MFNPKEEEITLVFNNVKETQKIFDLSRGLHKMKLADESLKPKIQNITFDAISESKEGVHHFYIEIKGLKSERITCERYSITENMD